jgi:hypothetical protein
MDIRAVHLCEIGHDRLTIHEEPIRAQLHFQLTLSDGYEIFH